MGYEQSNYRMSKLLRCCPIRQSFAPFGFEGDEGPCEGLPPEEVEPKPGMDDHLFRRFCALDTDSVGVGDAVEVGEETPDPTDVSMRLELFVLLVLAEEPVVLGEL